MLGLSKAEIAQEGGPRSGGTVGSHAHNIAAVAAAASILAEQRQQWKHENRSITTTATPTTTSPPPLSTSCHDTYQPRRIGNCLCIQLWQLLFNQRQQQFGLDLLMYFSREQRSRPDPSKSRGSCTSHIRNTAWGAPLTELHGARPAVSSRELHAVVPCV